MEQGVLWKDVASNLCTALSIKVVGNIGKLTEKVKTIKNK